MERKETLTSFQAKVRDEETRPMVWHPNFVKNGEVGCPLCGKNLKPKEARRYIHVGQGGVSILRADLPLGGRSGEAAILSTGPDTGDMGWFAVGSTCAKRLGAEFSKPLPPL
jgi:hypothetical protein